MLTQSAISAINGFVKESITSAKFKIGDESYSATVTAKEMLPDGRLAISVSIIHGQSTSAVITEVSLLDDDGNTWAIKLENMRVKPSDSGMLYRFIFTIEDR